MIPLRVGEQYFIRTPTYFYVGAVVELSVFGVRLGEGAYQINLLNDMPTFLATGKLAKGDELIPLPQGTVIPSLWVGPCDPFPYPMNWGRTHEAVQE